MRRSGGGDGGGSDWKFSRAERWPLTVHFLCQALCGCVSTMPPLVASPLTYMRVNTSLPTLTFSKFKGQVISVLAARQLLSTTHSHTPAKPSGTQNHGGPSALQTGLCSIHCFSSCKACLSVQKNRCINLMS